MTTKRTITRRFAGVALVSSLLAAPMILSAGVQHEGRRGRGDRGGRGGPGAIFRELDLSEQQREQLRALRQEGASTGAMDRLMQTRRALHDAVEEGTADEGALRQLAYDVGAAEGDAAVERARLHAQMMSILTPEQQETYKTLVAERKQKMEDRRERMKTRRNQRRDQNPDSF